MESILETVQWVGLPRGRDPTTLVLVDDVITKGTMFKACERLLGDNAPGVSIVAVFWARSVWPDDTYIEEAIR